MKIRLSCDDGAASDVKVAELAKKYNLECVFYWPVEWHSLAHANGYEPLSLEQAYDIVDDFEVGSHTITHRHLTKLPLEEAKQEISDSQFLLEDIFGHSVKKFCPPRGYTNSELTDYTLNHYDSQRLTKGITKDGYQLVHVHPDSGANDNRPWSIVASENEKVELWMHSHELDRFGLWEQLESFLHENIYS